MRKMAPMIFLLLIVLAAPLLPAPSEAQVDMGLSVGDEGLRSFYLAVGNYYHVPQTEVTFVYERGIPHYELPVVFFLARQAHVPPAAIIDLRLNRYSWADITFHYGLSPEIYYVPVTITPGPPYGKAYGYYKKKPKKQWKTIVLADDDVVNLVNLRFLSGYHHIRPEEVIRYRSKGRDFVVIHDDFHRKKQGKGRVSDDRGKGHSSRKYDDGKHNGGHPEQGKSKGQKEHKEQKEHKDKGKGKGKKED